MKPKLLRVLMLVAAISASLVLIAAALEIDIDNNVKVVGYNDDEDYMQEMILALEDGSEYAIYVAKIYEAQRNLKIQELGLSTPVTDFFSDNQEPEIILQRIYDYLDVTPSGYELTTDERALVEAAVMAEAGGESFQGQMMIAQCILDGALRKNEDVATFIAQSQIVTSSLEPYQSCSEAVSAVFDLGRRVTDEVADIWYAPALTTSEWHESQIYVTTIGSHKFFRKTSV